MINVDRSIIIVFDRTVKFHALSPSFRRKIRHEDCDKLRVSPTHRSMQIGASRACTRPVWQKTIELDELHRRPGDLKNLGSTVASCYDVITWESAMEDTRE